MGACGMSWTVEVPPWGWSRFIGGWGVRGIDGWGRDVSFQPDRYGRVPVVAMSIAVRQAEPGLGDTIQRAARAAVIQDLPAGRGYGWKGGARRKALCQAIADRLNAAGTRPVPMVPRRATSGLPEGFLLSDAEAAEIQARGDAGRVS